MISVHMAHEWTVISMTAADDLIRRRDAIYAIQSAMKRGCTAARKLGYKESMDILMKMPSTQEVTVSLVAPVTLSPAPLHSYWFYNAGWFFCDNCGGRCSESRQTPYCPHCGARMDLKTEIE